MKYKLEKHYRSHVFCGYRRLEKYALNCDNNRYDLCCCFDCLNSLYKETLSLSLLYSQIRKPDILQNLLDAELEEEARSEAPINGGAPETGKG